MRHPLYRYNAQTCQYERVRLKFADVLFYMSGVLISAILMLAGMLILHDFLIDSEKEVALRKENNALEKNHALLTNQLNIVESTLATLEEEDKKLHYKFFGSPVEQSKTKAHGASKKNVLLADASSFRDAIKKIEDQSADLITKSLQSNLAFGDNITFTKQSISNAVDMPTIQPVHPWQPDKLLSGFGMRINPFHKGLYKHPGIDLAVARGTTVVATASGKVTQIKRNDLQAGYGNFIEIDHGNGFITRYAHLEEISVKMYQAVDKGAVIGTSGNSGGSIAPHLHYEIIRDGKNVDPVNYMIAGLTSQEFNDLKFLSDKHNQSLD